LQRLKFEEKVASAEYDPKELVELLKRLETLNQV
jgi:hypothetical protein